MEWCKGKILTTRDSVNIVRIARDAGLQDDTKVIVMIPFSSFRTELNPEWVWQGCVTSGTLVAVEMVKQCDLPIPPSPSLEAAPMTNILSVYVSEKVCKLYQYKNQDYVWLQPMRSFSVEEVWLSPSPNDVAYVDQFLDQLTSRVINETLLVNMGRVFPFELQDKMLYFDVVQVSPMCQGHLTSDTNVFVLPFSNNISPPLRSDSDTDSDEMSGKIYHVQPGIIEDRHGDGSDDDTESEDDLTNQLHSLPRTKLPSSSQIRKSSVVTLGNAAHLLTCIPINNFPSERNFIILPSKTLKKLNCYGLENLLISPVDLMQPDDFHGVSFVAVIEETKECMHHHHHGNCLYPPAYLHPELFYNLFPYPMDRAVADCVIRAEVYRAGVSDAKEPFVRYTELTLSAVNSASLGGYLPLPLEQLIRKYFRRECEQFLAINYVFGVHSDYGVIFFKVISTVPQAPLGSVGMQTAVKLKYPTIHNHTPDPAGYVAKESYWLEICPPGLDEYYKQLMSYCIPVYYRTHPQQSCVIITGPPGIGKTTVAKAVARMCRVNLVEVNCYHDVMSDHVPNIVKRLTNMFDDAEVCAPSMLLLRKAHALCKEKEGQREDPRIAQTFEKLVKRVITWNTSSNPPIMVIGVTSWPNRLLQRISGCFIHEVAMTTPDQDQRIKIMKGLSKGMSLAKDIDFTDLSHKTPGLLLGDFATMVTYASQLAVDDVINYCFPSGMTTSLDEFSLAIAGATIAPKHFEASLKLIHSAHNDAIGAPKVPSVSWHDVGGLDVAKKEILDTIQLPLDHPELFSKGLRRSGILLYGAPGTGKTLLAKAVATECSLNFLSVKGPELINMFVGQSEENIREVFARAKTASPCVIFFDELDSLAPNRGNNADSGGVMDRIVSQLLAELDGLQSNEDIFVIGATNRPDLLDPSLLRPGRFDRLVYLDVTNDVDSRVNILEALTRGIHLHDNVSLYTVAKRCPDNITGADLFSVCNEATRNALRRTIIELDDRGISDDEWTPPLLVSSDDFYNALYQLKPSVSARELENYRTLHETMSHK